MDKPDYLDWIEETMDLTGCDFDTAKKVYKATFDDCNLLKCDDEIIKVFIKANHILLCEWLISLLDK